MSHFLNRLKDSISADLNDMLDQKEQKNPIAVLNQHLRNCRHEAKRVRELIDRQYLLKDQFMRDYHEADDMAGKRMQQLNIVKRSADRELQTLVQSEHDDYVQKAARLKTAYEQCVRQVEQLEQKYADMQHKLKDMHLRRMELMSRENIANAERHMNQVIRPSSEFGQAYSHFEESEQYLERIERKINTDYQHCTVDARVRQLEKELAAQNKTDQ
ncbi:MAG: PspA/IM30 family protein [Sporolactobacillus sp.]